MVRGRKNAGKSKKAETENIRGIPKPSKCINIEIIRSNRKSVAIEIKADLRVVVRAPLKMRNEEIERFIEAKTDWLTKHMQIARQRFEAEKTKPKKQGFSAEELRELAEQAAEIIPKRTEYFAQIMGVNYGRITIRNQVSRWGSCSSKGNLNFNCLLMLCPPAVLDYVVVHELCHLKQMNHSPEFWAEVAAVLPEYEKEKKWLRNNGNLIIERLRQREILRSAD